MRKIKFRAYDKVRKEYLSSGHIFLSINPSEDPAESVQYLDLLKDPNAYASRFVIEQFTGIVDKNGKAIYEGDIVHFINPGLHKDIKAKVIFDRGDFCLDLGSMNHWPMGTFESVSFEKIGNIHNNPELLKSEKS